MSFMRLHWFDVGLVLGLATGVCLLFATPSSLSLLLWISLISLFVHQFEEYRFPGYFPETVNLTVFKSRQPDRYPLNTNTSLIVNVGIGWSFYLLAAVFGERAIWLGMATMLVSIGNVIAHTFYFNLKGRTFYNPGMVTADILFIPIAGYFFYFVVHRGSLTILDWIVGVGLGIALNYIGIIKMIDWLKDEHTTYIFPKRCLPPAIRQTGTPSVETAQ